jgi:hypothetical protein
LEGKIIKSNSLSQNSLQTMVDISSAKSSLYFIELVKEGETLFHAKLIKTN